MITAFIDFFSTAPEPMLSINHYNANKTIKSHWRIYSSGHVVFNNILANQYDNQTKSYNTNHVVVERIQELINIYKIYDYNDKYDNILEPQPYTIIKLNTEKGKKTIHIEPLNPVALNQFVQIVISILNKVNH